MTALGIVIDQKCNVRCEHCCFNSGPKSSQHMTDELVFDLVRQGLEDPRVTTIALSGGEALLRYETVLTCLRMARDAGKPASLVSNGHWGQSRARALSVLRALKDAGLTCIKISYDDFHAQYIPPSRVQNILDANRSVRIPLSLTAAVTRSRTSEESLSAVGDSLLGVAVTRFPVQPVGAAADTDPAEIIRTVSLHENPRCPGFEPTYHFDGLVYPCCSPTVFDTSLSLGAIEDLSVSDTVSAISRNMLLATIRKRGFRWLVDQCQIRGVDLGIATDSFVDACEICHTIFSRPDGLQKVAQVLHEVGELSQHG